MSADGKEGLAIGMKGNISFGIGEEPATRSSLAKEMSARLKRLKGGWKLAWGSIAAVGGIAWGAAAWVLWDLSLSDPGEGPWLVILALMLGALSGVLGLLAGKVWKLETTALARFAPLVLALLSAGFFGGALFGSLASAEVGVAMFVLAGWTSLAAWIFMAKVLAPRILDLDALESLEGLETETRRKECLKLADWAENYAEIRDFLGEIAKKGRSPVVGEYAAARDWVLTVREKERQEEESAAIKRILAPCQRVESEEPEDAVVEAFRARKRA